MTAIISIFYFYFYCPREVYPSHGAAAAQPGGENPGAEQDVQPGRGRGVAGESTISLAALTLSSTFLQWFGSVIVLFGSDPNTA